MKEKHGITLSTHYFAKASAILFPITKSQEKFLGEDGTKYGHINVNTKLDKWITVLYPCGALAK